MPARIGRIRRWCVQCLVLFSIHAWVPLVLADDGKTAFSDYVIGHRWLAEPENRQQVLILDTRPEQEYLGGHIPEAVNLPVAATFGAGSRDDLVAPLNVLQELFSKAGIDNQTKVVIYDSGNYIDAARVAWILESLGHAQITIVDGGFTAWQNDTLPISTQPRPRPKANFIPEPDPDRLATMLSTRIAIDSPGVMILDARTPAEYAGERSKASRFGHIPTAINIPWRSVYRTEDGETRLKSEAEIRAMYSGLDPDKKVITYCNKGKQSALTHFILRRLGYDVAAYDGSWVEWGNTRHLPIVNPSAEH